MHKTTAKFTINGIGIKVKGILSYNTWVHTLLDRGFNCRFLELNDHDVTLQFFCSERQSDLTERKTQFELDTFIKNIRDFDRFVAHDKEVEKPDRLEGIKQNPAFDDSWFSENDRSTHEVNILVDRVPTDLKGKGKRRMKISGKSYDVFDMGIFDE